MLETAWVIVPFAALYVGLGCGLGYASWWCSGSAVKWRSLMIACVGFPNSQGLPIMLIEVIAPAIFDDANATALMTAYVALYLVLYLLLQWTVGAAIMRVPLSDEEPVPHEAEIAEKSTDIENTAIRLQSIEEEEDKEGVVSEDEAAPLGIATRDHLPEEGICQRAKGIGAMLLKRVGTPPVYGIVIGLTTGLSPSVVVGLLRGKEAPLAFLLQAVSMIGSAAIPLMMMLLGSHLHSGPAWESISGIAIALITLSKLLVIPVLALGIVAGLVYTGALTASPMLLLVILMQSAMPTANNLLVMSELAGGRDSKAISTTMFIEYCTAPFFMTVSLTCFMSYIQSVDAGRQLGTGNSTAAGLVR